MRNTLIKHFGRTLVFGSALILGVAAGNAAQFRDATAVRSAPQAVYDIGSLDKALNQFDADSALNSAQSAINGDLDLAADPIDQNQSLPLAEPALTDQRAALPGDKTLLQQIETIGRGVEQAKSYSYIAADQKLRAVHDGQRIAETSPLPVDAEGSAASAKAKPAEAAMKLDAADESGSFLAPPEPKASRSKSTKSKEISMAWIHSMIRNDAALDPATRRLRNVVQVTGFKEAALNLDVLNQHNNHYNVELSMGPMTDQANSGRCWIFAGLNMIRSRLITDQKVSPDFEFSENYLYFFSMLEKSNRYLENAAARLKQVAAGKRTERSFQREFAINEHLGDGGWFEWFQFLVAKYGLAPRSAMHETANSQATMDMGAELKRVLASAVGEMQDLSRRKGRLSPAAAAQAKKKAMARIWTVLATHLGQPPSRFEIRGEAEPEMRGAAQVTPVTMHKFTPQQFARQYVGFNPNDYVVVSNYAHKKLGTVYAVKGSGIAAVNPGHRSHGVRFMNVGADRLEELVVASINGGSPVWFGADIDKDVDRETGIMHPKIYDRAPLYGFSDKEAELSRERGSYFMLTEPNHAMAITGYDRPDLKAPAVKFKVENSWGEEIGSEGYFHMYRDWLRENVFEAIIHKDFLTPAERKAWLARPQHIAENEVF